MVDLFNEVDEELRSDRALNILRRAAPWATAVLALVLAGYLAFWGYKSFQDRNLTAAAIGYQKGADALATGDSKTALDGFEAAKKAGSPGYKALALIQEGALRAEAKKPDEAAKLFDQGRRRSAESDHRRHRPAAGGAGAARYRATAAVADAAHAADGRQAALRRVRAGDARHGQADGRPRRRRAQGLQHAAAQPQRPRGHAPARPARDRAD